MPSKPEVLKERRANDPEYAERVRNYARAYRERNKEKEQERQRKCKAKRRSECKDVNNAYMREWNAKNKDRLNRQERERRANDVEYAEKVRARDRARPKFQVKNTRLLSVYGITLDEYNAMYAAQEGKCAICKGEFELGGFHGLSVDHCHTKGNVREMLCPHCNHGLGKFKDNIERIKNAVAYLTKHK